jgi:hypothetical protein
MSPTMTEFTQEFLRGNKEGIVLKNAADDDHRMGPHEGADVTSLVKQRAGKRNWSRGPLHCVSPTWMMSCAPLPIRMHHSDPPCPTDTLVFVDTFVQ